MTRPVNMSMGPIEWGLLITLSLLWGGAFIFNTMAVRELPTLTVVVCRLSLAAVTLLIIMRVMGQRLPRSGLVWAAFFAMGLLNNAIPFSLLVWGQSHIGAGVASILNATTPLFTVLVAHAFTRDEKLTIPRSLGVVIGLVGVAVMIGPDVLDDLGVNIWAQLACLGAALSYAFAAVFGRRFREMGVTPMATATGQVIASSLILLPVMLVIDQPWTLPMPSPLAIGALIAVAILSTALAYIIFFRILSAAGATNLALVTFLIPVSAVLLGVLLLGEVILPKHIVGMALISLGLAAIDGRPWRKLKAAVLPT